MISSFTRRQGYDAKIHNKMFSIQLQNYMYFSLVIIVIRLSITCHFLSYFCFLHHATYKDIQKEIK